jgi:hypothetical protein
LLRITTITTASSFPAPWFALLDNISDQSAALIARLRLSEEAMNPALKGEEGNALHWNHLRLVRLMSKDFAKKSRPLWPDGENNFAVEFAFDEITSSASLLLYPSSERSPKNDQNFID